MTCPICKSETVKEFRPFCSRRCANLDLGRWFSGAYTIPSEEPVDDDMEPAPSAPPTEGRSH